MRYYRRGKTSLIVTAVKGADGGPPGIIITRVESPDTLQGIFPKSTAFTWRVQIGKRPQKTGGTRDRWKRDLEGDWMNPSVHD